MQARADSSGADSFGDGRPFFYTQLMDGEPESGTSRGAQGGVSCGEGSGQSGAVPVRVMALDLGNRRIGVAVTDELGYTAQPLMTISSKTPRADVKSIARLARKHGVGEIVVGKPLHLSGETSPRAARAEAFAESLRAELAIPVQLVDERLTSWEADQLLGKVRNAADRRARKQVVDQVAAVLILETFLQARDAKAAREDQ